MRRQSWLYTLFALLAASLALALAACGDDDDDEGDGGGGGEPAAGVIERNDANSEVTITVGSKNFDEQKILGEIYAQGLEAAGYDVKKQLNLGDEQTALKALESDEIDAYPEYTGTALGSFFGVKSNEIPKDPAQAYEDTKAGFAEKGLTAFPTHPLHQLERGRRDAGDRRGARPRDDLGPEGQGRRPGALGHARVPPAQRLPARA